MTTIGRPNGQSGGSAWRQVLAEQDWQRHLTTLEGWREFTTAETIPPQLLSDQQWAALAEDQAAGPRLAEAGAAIGPCDPGDAMATPAFDLDPPVKHVIHTVGPIWEDGAYGEAEVLASCYRRCLQVADDLATRSIAFPAIATGVYGFPPQQAARIAIDTLASTPTNVQHIRLVAFDEETHDLLTTELAQRSAST